MKLTVAGESPIERALLALGIPPVALMDTHMSFMRARSIMVGTKLGIFEALVSRPRDAASIAGACGTAPGATEKLLNAPAASGYLHFNAGVYSLSPLARKWLVADSPPRSAARCFSSRSCCITSTSRRIGHSCSAWRAARSLLRLDEARRARGRSIRLPEMNVDSAGSVEAHPITYTFVVSFLTNDISVVCRVGGAHQTIHHPPAGDASPGSSVNLVCP